MDINTNGNMHANGSTPTTPTAATAQDTAQGWTYERRLAFYILGKLAVQGALSDLPLSEFDYVIDGIVDSISEGLEALCCEGNLETMRNLADIGALHKSSEGAQS